MNKMLEKLSENYEISLVFERPENINGKCPKSEKALWTCLVDEPTKKYVVCHTGSSAEEAVKKVFENVFKPFQSFGSDPFIRR